MSDFSYLKRQFDKLSDESELYRIKVEDLEGGATHYLNISPRVLKRIEVFMLEDATDTES